MERDFFGRCARPLWPAERKAMINRESKVSVRQCELLGLCRSSLYYRPKPISEADLLLICRLDELHLNHPFLGARRLAASSSARASIWVAVMWAALCS